MEVSLKAGCLPYAVGKQLSIPLIGDTIEKVRKDDMARTFEFLFRFNRVWINSRLL